MKLEGVQFLIIAYFIWINFKPILAISLFQFFYLGLYFKVNVFWKQYIFEKKSSNFLVNFMQKL